MRPKASRLCAAVAVGLILTPAASARADGALDEDSASASAPLRDAMDEIYLSMQFLLPHAIEVESFSAPQHAQSIRSALERVALRADGVEEHVGDAPGRHLARTLADDARRAARLFERDDFDAAAFFVREIVDDCVGCHSRLERSRDAPIARGFSEHVAFADLGPLERARLAVATRQFDRALEDYERGLRDPAVHPAEIEAWLVEYLVTSVRVVRDVARPVPVLRGLAARADLWEQLRRDLRSWADTLEAHKLSKPAHTLAAARALFDEGRTLDRVPADRRGLVHYLLASRTLHDLVAANDREGGSERAAAFLLLGLCEMSLERGAWHPRSEFYLEQAVELAPHTPVGAEAFARLEESVLFGYTGSGGTHLPADESQRLARLRALASPAAPE